MAVRSLFIASALLCGCSGSVIDGVPLDGGEGSVIEPAGELADGGSGRDAGRSTGQPDAPARGPGDSTRGDDAGIDAGPAAPDAGSPAQPGTRDLSTDKAKFLGQPRCEAAGVELCDDFESEAAGATPDPAVWSAPYGYMPTVDEARAARGAKSLHFSRPAGMPGLIQQTKSFPATGNNLYGRMFVWFGSLPSAPDAARWSVAVALAGSGGTEVRVSGQYYQDEGGKNLWGVASDGGDSGDWLRPDRDPLGAPKLNEWTCVEWRFARETNETWVWIDAVEQPSLHTTATEYREEDEMGQQFIHPQYDKLRIGWWAYYEETTPSPIDVWVDEVAVDDQRIGCVL